MSQQLVEVDGSMLEGGGQILRVAVSLSALLKIPIKITKIRAGRSKPGLMAQHLTGLLLARDITNGIIKNAEIGSTQIEFYPKQINGGEYRADTRTAGSVALLLQVALPCCFFSTDSCILNLRGGTNADMAPQIDYITEVFRPNLEKFGATFDFDLIKRGYYPKGGGEISVFLNKIKSLNPIQLTSQGKITKIYGWSYVAGNLPIKVAHLAADAAVSILKEKIPNARINIERYKETAQMAPDTASGINLVCETDTGCVLGGSALGKRGISAQECGAAAAREILNSVEDGACVDKHCQDQIMLFMALASGKSAVRVGEITVHTQSAIHVIQLLTQAKFNIINDGPTSNIIECNGIDFQNKY